MRSVAGRQGKKELLQVFSTETTFFMFVNSKSLFKLGKSPFIFTFMKENRLYQ